MTTSTQMRGCDRCGDLVQTLSSRDLCDGCEEEDDQAVSITAAGLAALEGRAPCARTFYVTKRGSTVEIAADSAEHALRRVLGKDVDRYAISAYGDFAEARFDGRIIFVAIRARDEAPV